MDEQQEIQRLRRELRELQDEVISSDATKGLIGGIDDEDKPKNTLSSEGLKIESNGKRFALFRDYSREDFDTSKLKRLVRN